MHFKFTSLLAFLVLSKKATAAGGGGGGCPAGSKKFIINFDRLPDGKWAKAGETISDQWADFGVLFSGFRRLNKKRSALDDEPALRLFDSTRPTGGDHDLGSPNELCEICYNNPNLKCRGVAKKNPQTAAETNCRKQNKILIIDSGWRQPNDFRFGGEVEITFTVPVTKVIQLGFLDVQNLKNAPTSTYTILDSNGESLVEKEIVGLGDNAWQQERVNFKGPIASILLDMYGSFGLTHLKFCAAEEPPSVETGTPTIPPTGGPAVMFPTVYSEETAPPSVTPTTTPTVYDEDTEPPTVTPTTTPTVYDDGTEPPTVGPTMIPTVYDATGDPTLRRQTMTPTVGPDTGDPTQTLPTTQPTVEDLTGDPTLSLPTTQPTIVDLTGDPTLAKPTTQPTIEDLTGDPTLAKPTTQPTVEDLTGDPTLTTLTPTVTPFTSAPGGGGDDPDDICADDPEEREAALAAFDAFSNDELVEIFNNFDGPQLILGDCCQIIYSGIGFIFCDYFVKACGPEGEFIGWPTKANGGGFGCASTPDLGPRYKQKCFFKNDDYNNWPPEDTDPMCTDSGINNMAAQLRHAVKEGACCIPEEDY